MLSLLSALVAISTAFAGISIYAQTDDSNMTTCEEEAAKPTEEGTAMDNTTSTSSSNSTLAHRSNATSLSSSNQTSTASAPESGGQILVIEGQDFVPRQAVLIFSEKALLAIDDVDSDGSIHAKVPMPKGGGTTIAGNDTASTSTELRFVDRDPTNRDFRFDGQKLTAAPSGEIAAKGAGLGGNAGTTTAAASSANTTSTNNTGSSYTLQ